MQNIRRRQPAHICLSGRSVPSVSATSAAYFSAAVTVPYWSPFLRLPLRNPLSVLPDENLLYHRSPSAVPSAVPALSHNSSCLLLYGISPLRSSGLPTPHRWFPVLSPPENLPFLPFQPGQPSSPGSRLPLLPGCGFLCCLPSVPHFCFLLYVESVPWSHTPYPAARFPQIPDNALPVRDKCPPCHRPVHISYLLPVRFPTFLLRILAASPADLWKVSVREVSPFRLPDTVSQRSPLWRQMYAD